MRLPNRVLKYGCPLYDWHVANNNNNNNGTSLSINITHKKTYKIIYIYSGLATYV
jgi:hypothetical protein